MSKQAKKGAASVALRRLYQMLAWTESAMEFVRRGSFRSNGGLRNYTAHGWGVLANSASKGSIIVYAATMGEFTAVRPLLNLAAERYPWLTTIVLAGQRQYVDAMHAGFSNSVVITPLGPSPGIFDKLFELARPRLIVYSEGPCLHARFPIRCDLGLAAACLRHGIPAIVTNACLYKLHIQSTFDAIEHRFFSRLHSDAIVHWYAPTKHFQELLVGAGVAADKISTVGDMKFDTITTALPGPPSSELADILGQLNTGDMPVVVAGSVNAIDEQSAVILGWLELRESCPNAKLVIAPRYVNNPEVMNRLYGYLEKKGVRFARRSEGPAATRTADAIVIDVFGELPYYYANASLSYIGRNHGVLEPLRYGKPVVVAPADDWDKDYAAFPLYDLMRREQGILEVDEKGNLGKVFTKLINDKSYSSKYTANAARIIREQQGAARRVLDHVEARFLSRNFTLESDM